VAGLLPWLAVALALLVFAGALGYIFVDDDVDQIYNNPCLRSWDWLPQYFTHNVWSRPGTADLVSNYYRPLFLVWLRLNYLVFEREPAGWHAAAILLHAAATLLVFLLAMRTLRDRIAAGFAGLFFAVHPLHVESVAWISGANEAEYALLSLAAVLCYLRWREGKDIEFQASDSGPKAIRGSGRAAGSSSGISSRKFLWFLLSLVCYALSLLAKETAATICALIFLYEWKRRRGLPRPGKPAAGCRPTAQGMPPEPVPAPPGAGSRWNAALRAAWITLPYLAVTAAYMVVRALVLHGLAPDKGSHPSLASVLFSLPETASFYLRKLLWALPMSQRYPIRLVAGPGLATFVWPLAAALAALWGLWIWGRRDAAAAIASAWLLLPLAPPVLAIARFRFYDLVHDRYLYLPTVGLAMLMALAVRRLRPGGRSVGGVPVGQVALLCALTCLLGGITAWQARYWSNALPLYRHAAEVAPHNPLALSQLGTLLALEQHDPQAGLQLMDRAVSEAPDDFDTLLAAGVLRGSLRDYARALPPLLRACRLRPQLRAPHYWLGVVYMGMAQSGYAEAELREAIRLVPDAPNQRLLLGAVLENQNRLDDARAQYVAELQVKPDSAGARARLAGLEMRLQGQERTPEARGPSR
jgi:cytochrome c-type biogenesis protein CcmH/NrfG